MTDSLRSILNTQSDRLSLLVGNGINRLADKSNQNSWDGILQKLWQEHLGEHLTKSQFEGASLTEFYDALDLRAGYKSTGSKFASSLQKQFADQTQEIKPSDAHALLINWARSHEVPVLTTNFETSLSGAISDQNTTCKLFRCSEAKFTDYYPWDSYYATEEITDPSGGFGIWHINGMQKYYRSIRLGLGHYMGSVHRARTWLHRGGTKRLFNGKSHDSWKGSKTWLQCVFDRDIFIVGLGLKRDETFIRWLLIERAKYFKKFPEMVRKGWFVYKTDPETDGRNLFLNAVGIEPIEVQKYEEAYMGF